MSYFTLNPDIHIWRNEECALFFDVNQQRQFVFRLDQESSRIVDALKDIRNLNTISLAPNQVESPIVSALVQNNLGNIESSSSCRRVTLPPMYLFENRMDAGETLSSGYILDYVNVVSLYLAGECKRGCAHCDGLYRQGHFCINQKSSFSIKDRETLVPKLMTLTNLQKINLIISTINTSNLSFVRELSSLNVLLCCYIHWKNITPVVVDKIIAGKGKVLIKILIDLSDISEEQLLQIIDLQRQYGNHVILVFCVTCEKDYGRLSKHIDSTIEDNVEIRYVFTGQDKKHIEKYYLLGKEDLPRLSINSNRIFGNRELNYSLFGEFVIFPDGAIHLNQNTESVGTIHDNWIDMLNKALNEPNPWLMTRNKIIPCSNCMYRDLCPPIRNLELSMGDNLACVDYYKCLPKQDKDN